VGKVRFSFEDLEVWQKAVDFAKLVIELTEKIDTGRKHYRLIEQLEAASTSVAMNIAEGKGRYSKKEFIQFLFEEIKNFGDEIGKMLSSLINSIKSSMN
jgi:hypothetical protein